MISELKELGKPFLVVLNSAYPNSDRARAIRSDIAQRHQVTCVACNCLELGEADIHDLLKQVLYEFPLKELDLFLPPWVDAPAPGAPHQGRPVRGHPGRGRTGCAASGTWTGRWAPCGSASR